MRTISLWEPWGTAIAKGLKRIETRHWSTNYRGPLAIHCAKTRDHADFIFLPSVAEHFERVGITDASHLAFGCVVAICNLVGVIPTDELLDRKMVTPQEAIFGNYDACRFGWMLENIVPLKTPLPCRGSQGFFQTPDHLLTELTR